MDGTEGMLDDLPVPTALRDRIDAWQAVYDEHDDMDEDAPADADRFAADGSPSRGASRRRCRTGR